MSRVPRSEVGAAGEGWPLLAEAPAPSEDDLTVTLD